MDKNKVLKNWKSIVKMTILLLAIYKFKEISVKTCLSFFIKIENITHYPRIYMKYKRSLVINTILNKRHNAGEVLLHILRHIKKA